MNRADVAEKTLAQFGIERLAALCQAIGAGGECRPLLEVFQRLVEPWGAQRIGARPRYPSNVADDEAPFEFSLALSDGPPEVQVYVEVQGDPPSLHSNMKAGRARLETVARDLRVPLDRLHEIEGLFLPDQPHGLFSIWIGASWTARQPIRLKVYLNPQVQGAQRAPELVTEAMNRLGFARAWSALRRSLSFQGEKRDELAIISLDLSNARDARAKIYVRHRDATVRDIQAIARLTSAHDLDDIATFYAELAESEGPFSRKPALTELAFVDSDLARPSGITCEYPIGSYVANDGVACQRILSCLAALGIPSAHYSSALRGFAQRPLGESAGIHAHVTLRHVPRGSFTIQPPAMTSSDPAAGDSRAGPAGLVPRLAVYFASEAYPRGRGGDR